MPIIELKHLRKRFGSHVVFKDVSLSVEAGQSLVIIGASGSGKSVLLKHIVGLLEPDAGEVWFKGKRIDQLTERQIMPIRKSFGFLFQMGALFDSSNVFDNVAFPLIEHTKKSTEEIAKIVKDRLTLVGLPDAGKKMPEELSGGQKKRVALARAIALEPEVMLYDEPTTGLDPIRADVINELIIKLKNHLKVTSIVVTHDMASAFKVADRIVMLHDGKIIYEGTPAETQKTDNPLVKHFVTGEASEKDLAAIRGAGEGTRVKNES